MDHALRALRSTVTTPDSGLTATLGPLPLGLRDALPPGRNDPLHFAKELPVRRGDAVLNRTDPSVEAVAHYVLESALDANLPPDQRPARRCAVIRTTTVSTRTTLLIIRYRFHLQLPSRSGTRELVAEDVATLAFEGSPAKPHWLSPESVTPLLHARPSGNVPGPQASQFLTRALDGLPDIAKHLADHGEDLAAGYWSHTDACGRRRPRWCAV